MKEIYSGYLDTPCISRLAISESKNGIVNDLVANILYGDKGNINRLNFFIEAIDFDSLVIEDAEDLVLFLRALHDQLYKDKFICAIEDYLGSISLNDSAALGLLLQRVINELEISNTLMIANSICHNAGYIESKRIIISKNISDLVSKELFEYEMEKSMEHGKQIIDSHKQKTVNNILPVATFIASVVFYLFLGK